MREQDNQASGLQSMNYNEARFNSVDISNQNGVQAMIPGINNLSTVGSSPLKRGIKQ